VKIVKHRTAALDDSLFSELICCLLGGCAFCSAILPAIGQETGMMECALLVFVDLSLVFFLSRRWWITPALLAAAGLAFAAAVLLFHRWDMIADYARGFLEWYAAAFPYTLPYSENGSLFLLRLIFSFPITLLFYVYFRKLPFLPVWIVLSGGLILWLYLTASERMLSVAVLLLIVTFALISRTNARSINRKLGASEKIPSAAMQFTALALGTLAVLFSFAIGPKTDGAWRSRALVNIVEDIQDVFAFYGSGSSGEGGFSLAYSGLAPNGYALGGDISPDNRTVMRVKTASPILLAGAVYDGYDGRGWYDTGTLGRFRFNSPLWRGRRRQVFCVGKPSSGKTAELFGKVSRPALLEVSLSRRLRVLFAGGKIESLTLPYSEDSAVFFNSQGELYVPDYPDMAVAYKVRTRCFDRDAEGFDDNMRQLVRTAASSRDRDYEELYETNTAVPDTVETFVRELAAELTAGCDNDYDRALAIENWLSENCSYTMKPGDPPVGRDFVSAFLESREGYCTYYATAMTVLARLSGLPARYVTGYGLKQSDSKPDTTSYIATNATAHAWSQIYFYGVGWMDFDPLRWEFYELAASDPPFVKEAEPSAQPQVPQTEPPKPPEPENSDSDPDPSAAADGRLNSRAGRILLIVLAAYLASMLLFLAVRSLLLFFRAESFYYHLIRRHPDRHEQADICYRRLLKQLGFLGLELEPPDTISSFCARVDEVLEHSRLPDRMSEICRPVLLSRFAMRKPREVEIRRMCEFYTAMERELRRTLGMRKYVLRRVILGR